MPRAPSYQTSSPHRMDPASGVSRPAIKRSTVVFPAPDGPNNTVTDMLAQRHLQSGCDLAGRRRAACGRRR